MLDIVLTKNRQCNEIFLRSYNHMPPVRALVHVVACCLTAPSHYMNQDQGLAYISKQTTLCHCTGCITKQLTHITWHNFVTFNALLILFTDLTRWDHTNFGSALERYIPIKRKCLCHFIVGVKIIQRGAGEIQAKYNFDSFPFKKLKSFKQLDHFSTTRQSLQHKQMRKKTATTPENISPVRGSVRRFRSPCSNALPEQRWPPVAFLWTAVEMCKCSINFRYVIFQNC